MNTKNDMTPWQVFGVALAIVLLCALLFIGMDWMHKRDIQRLKWMEEHPAEVNQWLRNNNGGL